MTDHKRFRKRERIIYRVLIVLCSLVLVVSIASIYFMEDLGITNKKESDSEYTAAPQDDPDRIENGIHVRTGLVEANGLVETINNCTTCHSAKIVTQNRLNREGWITTIRWMQETQNLWDLGENEEIIINYLVRNYPPEKKGRRGNLKEIKWYTLKK